MNCKHSDMVAVVRLDRLARSVRHLVTLAGELEALGNDNSNGIDNIVVTPVPEPATGLLVMVGMLGLAVARRRTGVSA
ncbi:MAG TPA: PEP-CTERM sorting domain-containing protein [Myxococcota bacterium]|nr:PEP-CTERM sorting domain-containing protein [Myxococcota bacterium]